MMSNNQKIPLLIYNAVVEEKGQIIDYLNKVLEENKLLKTELATLKELLKQLKNNN